MKNNKEEILLERSIGIIDSGIGGLTVAREIMDLLPNENIIYLGDTARCPYGARTEDEIVEYTLEIVEQLVLLNIKALVIACNTMTAYTLKYFQEKLSIPIIGVIEPGARTAIRHTKSKYIGIIGTEATIRSESYENHLRMMDGEIKTLGIPCPLFVPYVENGIFQGEQLRKIIETSLQPLKQEKQIDTLIFGCTHFPLLKPAIKQVLNRDLTFVSPSKETARDLMDVLIKEDDLRTKDDIATYTFLTTGKIQTFNDLIEKIIPNEIINHRNIEIKHLRLLHTN